MWWRKTKAAVSVADAGIIMDDHDAAVAAARAAGHAEGRAAGRAEGLAEGEKQGRAEALARATAILGLPEAQGRMPQAILMLNMDISLEVAPRILAAIPTTQAPATSPVPSLDQRGAAPLH